MKALEKFGEHKAICHVKNIFVKRPRSSLFLRSEKEVLITKKFENCLKGHEKCIRVEKA